MASRRRRLLLLLIPLLLVAGPAAWIGSLFLQAERTIRSHARQSRARLETFAPEVSGRPPVFDPPENGDAWDLELLAISRINQSPLLKGDVSSRHRYAKLAEEPLMRYQARTYDVSEPNLDLLRSALRRRSVTPAWRPGWELDDALQSVVDALRHAVNDLHHRGKDFAAFERLILAVGLAQDMARPGDLQHRSTFWNTEVQAAFHAREILESHRLSSDDLRTVATWLDRLSAARPPMARTMATENALDQVAVSDPTFRWPAFQSGVRSTAAPTWRELWSPLLRDAKHVATLARLQAGLEGLDAVPPWDREAAAAKRFAASDLSPDVPEPLRYRYDARALVWMMTLRTAVAVAWYETDRGTLPGTLKDLVPRYLPEVPPSPPRLERNGLRVDLPLGVNPDPDLEGDPSMWRIGRKATR